MAPPTEEHNEHRIYEIQHRIYEILNNFRTSWFGVILFYGYMLAVAVLAPLTIMAILNNRETAQDARRGLCSLKVQREQRVIDAKFILDNPDDPDNVRLIQLFGKQFIHRSLNTAQQDLDALKDVPC